MGEGCGTQGRVDEHRSLAACSLAQWKVSRGSNSAFVVGGPSGRSASEGVLSGLVVQANLLVVQNKNFSTRLRRVSLTVERFVFLFLCRGFTLQTKVISVIALNTSHPPLPLIS